ncbi:MAG: hypothetical protein IKV83_02805 [Muribaculaceae bacterium]|nr:hypothetical protein [Muribaculaceae bacterium]
MEKNETLKSVSNVEIKVLDMEVGWQTINLMFDEICVLFRASYLGVCPLSSLISVVAEIDRDIEYGNIPDQMCLRWYKEPGMMQFDVKYDGKNDYISIKITDEDFFLYGKQYSDIENPMEEYHFEVSHEIFKSAVIKEATRMLKQYGIRGYNENWLDNFDEFPISSYLQLLGNESEHDKESDILSSNLKEEARLLSVIADEM